MKKNGIINADLSELIAKMGHKDKMVICDSGLPIPLSANRIDLALKRGTPEFLEVLETVLDELVVEKAILATEIEEESPELYKKTKEILSDIPVEFCTHEEFKKMSKEAKGIVRSGEIIPYANIILISGVDF